MTIEKEPPGVWMLTCDNCQARVALDTDPYDSFYRATRDAMRLGWEPRRVNDGWTNICTGCIEKTKQQIIKDAIG
jgi:hypothetical protein